MARSGGLSFGKRRRKLNIPLIKEVAFWILEIVLAVSIAYVSVNFFGTGTTVVGSAMESQLSSGDQILVNRFIYLLRKPKQGDVVVFLPNGNEKSHYYVRRVIAVPGDTVVIEDGAVYVNGIMYDEVDSAAIEDAGLAEDEITLGEDEYFVLGDNRNNSEDSRYANIGNVKEEYILGQAWFYFSSFRNFGFIQ
ncbi:MAG: signal peptidase I [Clostridiales bacterium]|nr:signal peptidase I [Clostridiales bacterium]